MVAAETEAAQMLAKTQGDNIYSRSAHGKVFKIQSCACKND